MLRFAKRGKTASTVAASVLCLAVTVGAGAAFAATGQLDTTFNTTGKVLLPSTGNDTAWDVATQPDGKIVAVGSTTTGNNAMVWRYNTNGTPDMGFNAADTPGSIALDFGGDDLATSVAIAPTGKILDSRQTLDSNGFLGSSTPTGRPTTASTRMGSWTVDSGGFDQLFGVAGTADGHVLAAGRAGTGRRRLPVRRHRGAGHTLRPRWDRLGRRRGHQRCGQRHGAAVERGHRHRVVGARCAGSTLATALAHRDWDVALVDRDTFPSTTVSTHLLYPNTLARLERLGVLDTLRSEHELAFASHRLVGAGA